MLRRLLAPLVALALLPVVLHGTSQAGTGPRALFFGDSLVAGVGTHPRRPVQVTDVARRLGWQPVVDAYPGTGWTTGGRKGRPYLWRLEHDRALRGRLDVVVLEGGTNDAFYGDLEELTGRVAEGLALVRRLQPHARIVLVGGYAPPGRDSARLAAMDQLLAAAAAHDGVQYVSQRGFRERTSGFLSSDRLHPNRFGYRLMAGELAKALSAVTVRGQ